MQEFVWPNGYKSAVVFSFDVDGSCREQQFDGTILGNNSQGDYGPNVGLPRILDLLDKHGLKGIFFVPGWIAERFPERIKDIHNRGHEIGAHGYYHETFTELSEAEEKEVHDKSGKSIADIVGSPPRAFRTPGGALTTRTMKNLLERGYDCDSSSVKDYFPSRVNIEGKEVNMAELPVSLVIDDFPYYFGGSRLGVSFLPISAPSEVTSYWIAEFDSVNKFGGLFMTLNHPRASGRVSRLRSLEKLIRHIKATPGVWITSAREVVDWVLKIRGGK